MEGVAGISRLKQMRDAGLPYAFVGAPPPGDLSFATQMCFGWPFATAATDSLKDPWGTADVSVVSLESFIDWAGLPAIHAEPLTLTDDDAGWAKLRGLPRRIMGCTDWWRGKTTRIISHVKNPNKCQ
jgi:hypothetical protein